MGPFSQMSLHGQYAKDIKSWTEIFLSMIVGYMDVFIKKRVQWTFQNLPKSNFRSHLLNNDARTVKLSGIMHHAMFDMS